MEFWWIDVFLESSSMVAFLSRLWNMDMALEEDIYRRENLNKMKDNQINHQIKDIV